MQHTAQNRQFVVQSSFFFSLLVFRLKLTYMSMQEEVSLASTVPDGDTDDLSEIMALAVQEVKHCSRVTDDSLP